MKIESGKIIKWFSHLHVEHRITEENIGRGILGYLSDPAQIQVSFKCYKRFLRGFPFEFQITPKMEILQPPWAPVPLFIFFSGLRFTMYNFTITKVAGSRSLVFCSPSDCGCVNVCMWVVLKPKPILYGKPLFLCCFYFQMTVEQDNVHQCVPWLRKNCQGISQWKSNSF